MCNMHLKIKKLDDNINVNKKQTKKNIIYAKKHL